MKTTSYSSREVFIVPLVVARPHVTHAYTRTKATLLYVGTYIANRSCLEGLKRCANSNTHHNLIRRALVKRDIN